jgi:hypothetical protein
MIKKKNGQITLFIILGIVILFIVALAVYLQTSSNSVRPSVEQLVVDDELKPIQLYVTDCLSAISKEGLIKLGHNGGYINIPTGMKVDPLRPYNSDVLFFDPQLIPYWYYMKSCSESSIGCIDSDNNPAICAKGDNCVLPYTGQNSMEEQLNNFIEEHISVCILDFEPFKNRFDIKTGKISVETKIAKDSVGFKLNYPLDIIIKGSKEKAKIPYFYTEHKLNLGKIYQFAQEIRDSEKNYNFLERNTLNLISAYSGVDSDLLPPMSGMDIFIAGKKYWVRTDVKEKIMSDVLPYTMLLQISNAGNAQEIYSRSTDPKTISFENGLYNSMMLKVSNNTYFDLNANIYYPQDSEIYLKIGDNEVIKPKNFDSGDNFIFRMMGFVMNDYSFRYDLSYPVIVSIADPNAFNGEGFTFNYAMEANIRQNLPVTENTTSAINVINAQTIDVDDISQRVDKIITIETYNKYTKEPLEDVTISYKCGGQFVIGTTSINSGKATLSDKFPFCEFGGEILYEKVGYMSGVIDYSNTQGTDSKSFRIEMWPLQEKKIKVYKRSTSDINSIRTLGAGGIVLYNSKYSVLNSTDTVFLNMARIKEDPRESDVPLVGFLLVKDLLTSPKVITKQDQKDYINALFTKGEITESDRNTMLYNLEVSTYEPSPVVLSESDYLIDLIPGTYVINAFMIYDGILIIPEEKTSLCTKVLGVCVTGETELILPEQNFSSWISGGVNINLTLTENDVYANNTLVIFVLEMPIPKTWSELQDSPDIETYQEDKLAFLYPTMEYP